MPTKKTREAPSERGPDLPSQAPSIEKADWIPEEAREMLQERMFHMTGIDEEARQATFEKSMGDGGVVLSATIDEHTHEHSTGSPGDPKIAVDAIVWKPDHSGRGQFAAEELGSAVVSPEQATSEIDRKTKMANELGKEVNDDLREENIWAKEDQNRKPGSFARPSNVHIDLQKGSTAAHQRWSVQMRTEMEGGVPVVGGVERALREAERRHDGLLAAATIRDHNVRGQGGPGSTEVRLERVPGSRRALPMATTGPLEEIEGPTGVWVDPDDQTVKAGTLDHDGKVRPDTVRSGHNLSEEAVVAGDRLKTFGQSYGHRAAKAREESRSRQQESGKETETMDMGR